MIDYSELKRLAEAANAVVGDIAIEMTLSSASGPNQSDINAVTAFTGAANPAAVLALIAEVERLVPFEEAYATACSVRNRLIKENELLDRLIVANKLISDSFRDERYQLKAEVEVLRKERDKLADDKRDLLEDFGGLL